MFTLFNNIHSQVTGLTCPGVNLGGLDILYIYNMCLTRVSGAFRPQAQNTINNFLLKAIFSVNFTQVSIQKMSAQINKETTAAVHTRASSVLFY